MLYNFRLTPTLLGTAIVSLLFLARPQVAAFDLNTDSNFVMYWGQNSRGQSDSQKPLAEYCQGDTVDVFSIAFMNGFPNILLNFANACETTFNGSTLLHCPQIGKDIKTCQDAGKAILLSLGGASGAYGFSSDSEAETFADTLWDMFFAGNATQRPFDDAVLDGIDLDIEGGSSTGYVALINRLRQHFSSDPSKKYYISGAPQCPFPDSYLGSTLNSAWMDMVFVQFYNNYCGLNHPSQFNFADWDKWASTQAINKDVKVFIGAPASSSAAGAGYVDASTLAQFIDDTRSKYKSFGGVMTWDASQAFANGDWATQVSSALKSGAGQTSSKARAKPILGTSIFGSTGAAPPADLFLSNKTEHGDISFVKTDAKDGNFHVLMKVQATNSPIPPHWELGLTMPPGHNLTSVSPGLLNSSISVWPANNGTLKIVADPADKTSHMALYLTLEGKYSGKFQLPDPSQVSVNQAKE
ncbi:Chitinase 2 [Spiromyces aspiralis]|uniref:Chitinase 2 n=1 Tax=Spiromyces aspiralis TaxID=68401 RepID=A0ACC1HEV4_9FUNG|nr:Chitinase 2 [Spiromyces aspiralis]